MKIEFHSDGFRELLTSGYAKKELAKHSKRITARANAVPSTTEPAATEPYYRERDASNSQRARRRIQTTSARAIMHDHKTQALLRNLG